MATDNPTINRVFFSAGPGKVPQTKRSDEAIASTGPARFF